MMMTNLLSCGSKRRGPVRQHAHAPAAKAFDSGLALTFILLQMKGFIQVLSFIQNVGFFSIVLVGAGLMQVWNPSCTNICAHARPSFDARPHYAHDHSCIRAKPAFALLRASLVLF